jgi:hypothetical protein
MQIPSKDVPQADVLDKVLLAAEGVLNGLTTYQQIANYIGMVERQGRYYRRAAEILGLIHRPQKNYSVITNLGIDFFNSSGGDQENLLRSIVLNTKFFHRMLSLFESHPEGVSRTEIITFMYNITEPYRGETDTDGSTARRFATLIGWLDRIKILEQNTDGNYRLRSGYTNLVPLTELKDISEPLLPRPNNLIEYKIVEERIKLASSDITLVINRVKAERANNAHIRLVNLVAEQLRINNVRPTSNKLIDLAANVNDQPYLFEMKSLTDLNVRAQLRRGLSQLYEYRYLQNLKNATLVLVVEKALPDDTAWMQHYLEEDRDIKLIWDGDNQLYASPKTRDELAFLWQR